jgi:hypothetical protein
MENDHRTIKIRPHFTSSVEHVVSGGDQSSVFRGAKALISLPLEFNWDGYELGQWWIAGYYSTVLPERLNTEQRERLLRNSIADEELRLDNPYNWPIFRSREFHIRKTISLDGLDKEEPLTWEINVSPHFATFLDSTVSHLREQKSIFDDAKRFVYENSSSAVYEGYSSALRTKGGQVTRIMHASADPMMGAWNREKAAKIRGSIEELGRRKNPNHPTFRSTVESLTGTVYSVSFPIYWNQRP